MSSIIYNARKWVSKNFESLVDVKSYLIYKFKGPRKDWSIADRTKYVMAEYEHSHGYRFDISSPVLFTEKIAWYKLFYDNELFPRIVDKVEFKKFIEERLGPGHTIPMYGAWDSIEDLERDWDSLPEEFFIKSNSSSAGHNMTAIHKKSEVNFKEFRKELKTWFDPRRTLINGDSMAYYKLKPRVLAEEYKSNIKDQLFDYKFFCFNGEPVYIYVAQDHFGSDGSHISFYDLDWNKLPVQYGDHIVGDAPCPAHFEQMKEYARKLAPGFPFVRVDFFDTGDELYLAEMTFYPGGGFTPYKPESFNKAMGDLFALPVNE